VTLDPHAFEGTAPYYTVGRPPYSEQLAKTLAEEAGLDGSGQLLDVGCGPGVLVLELSRLFASVVALDPEPGMLAEGKRRADLAALENIRWIEGMAEDIPTLGLGSCKLVSFGQSFHRVARHEVAEAVYDVLEPGGSIALVAHAVEGRPEPMGPRYPRIPAAEVKELIIRFLGDDTRRYLSFWAQEPIERFEETLANTRFEGSRTVFAPGRPDLVRDIDSVVAGFFSLSYAAPRHFGHERDHFESDLRKLLLRHSPEGLFWDWPGDTEIVLATKH
jgi:ubiquinone/menaquinone biosynthesis C-methylase UbiE